MTTKFGMLMTLNRCASEGQRSVSTLRTTACPAISDATFFTSGAAMRHGPHHAAQKSIRIGTRAPLTTSLKVCSSASKGVAKGGSSALQAPHFPASAMCSGGIRFLLPHDGHSRITMGFALVRLLYKPVARPNLQSQSHWSVVAKPTPEYPR
jgi:hypothetical protein